MVEMIFSQSVESSEYVDAIQVLSTKDDIQSLDYKNKILGQLLILNENPNLEVYRQLERLSSTFIYIFDAITNLEKTVNFYEIISDCGGDNSYSNKQIKFLLERIKSAIDSEIMASSTMKNSSRDSGVLDWYYSYLKYLSKLESLYIWDE